MDLDIRGNHQQSLCQLLHFFDYLLLIVLSKLNPIKMSVFDEADQEGNHNLEDIRAQLLLGSFEFKFMLRVKRSEKQLSPYVF